MVAKPKQVFIVMLATVLIMICACLPQRANRSGASRPKLIGGEPVRPDDFPSVFFIEDGCTGTKISDHHIITAAHCVTSDLFQDIKPNFAPENSPSIRLIFDKVFDPKETTAKNATLVTIVKTLVHPDYLTALKEEIPENDPKSSVPLALRAPYPPDLAVLEISEVANNDKNFIKFSNVPSAHLLPFEHSSNQGTDLVDIQILGYGCEVSNTSMRTGPIRLKSARSSIIASRYLTGISKFQGINFPSLVEKYLLTPGLSLPSRQVEESNQVHASLCAGDSGGPVFGTDKNGRFGLVAVNSFGSRDPSTGKTGVSTFNGHAIIDMHWLTSIGLDANILKN